jgi:ASC-1-like (ASCH) protein
MNQDQNQIKNQDPENKTWTMNMNEPYFSFIKNGQKTVEGRLNRGKFAEMKASDEVVISGEPKDPTEENNISGNFTQTEEGIVEQIKVKITHKNIYKTFREMLENEGVANTIPDAKTLDAAEQTYYKFFSQEDETNLGVAGIGIKISLSNCPEK